MANCGGTHRLKITTLGSNVTRSWVRMSDGQVETDTAVIAELETNFSDPNCTNCSNYESTDLSLIDDAGVNTNVPAGFKSVTINNITGTTTINGGFALGAGRRVNTISFGTDRSNCINEVLPAYTLSGGTWQWIGHR